MTVHVFQASSMSFDLKFCEYCYHIFAVFYVQELYSYAAIAHISYGNFVLVSVCHNPIPIGAQVR